MRMKWICILSVLLCGVAAWPNMYKSRLGEKPGKPPMKPEWAKDGLSKKAMAKSKVIDESEPDVKIINGDDADKSEYPFMVRLQMVGYGHICGASLIKPDVAMTAAHCVVWYGSKIPPNVINVVVGDHSDDDDGTEQLRNVSRIIVHEGYGIHPMGAPGDDIALLVLNEPVDLDAGVVETVEISENEADYQENKDIMVIGWGITDGDNSSSIAYTLQELSYQITPMDPCKEYWLKEAARYPLFFPEEFSLDDLLVGQLCARDMANEQARFSSGDSGGPLFVEESGSYKQIGIVSWGLADYNELGYDMFMDLRRYIGWINKWVAKAGAEKWPELHSGLSHGIVEATTKEDMSYICRNGAGPSEALSICNELGFENGHLVSAAEFLPKKSSYDMPFGLTNLQCTGEWDECTSDQYNRDVSMPCFYGEQLAVRCYDKPWKFHVSTMYPELQVKNGMLRGQVWCDVVAQKNGLDLDGKRDIMMDLILTDESAVKLVARMKYKKDHVSFMGKVKKGYMVENGGCLGCLAYIPGTKIYSVLVPEGCPNNPEHFQRFMESKI